MMISLTEYKRLQGGGSELNPVKRGMSIFAVVATAVVM